jgi:ArsR family transcriptional regulator, virulence genes transcriptional regulator
MNDSTVYELQADLCRAMSHAGRQMIIHVLFDEQKNVNEITSLTGISQSAVSRHLAILRRGGLVLSDRHGQEIFYRLANPKIVEVCSLMRTVLIDQMSDQSEKVKQLQQDYLK